MYKKGDFHIHSVYSDGGYTPREVVMLSKKRNVDIIALTDHNNTCGLDEAIMAGKEFGIKVIPGVELSTRYNNVGVHVLGYFKDDSYKNELLVEVLKNVKAHKLSGIRHILGKHINFHVRKDKLCVETGIEILKFFGATVVLAHPVLLNRADFKAIIKMDFDGLEAKYFSNRDEDTEYFLKVAKDKNLLYTAGSDFHSCNEFYRAHGIIGDVYLNEKEISNFLVGGNLPYL
ncbi:MAG: PHP domain-containing protein [Clostridium sp.]|uniref:PHP domain-containing protein n=1 Tax=Clostridium sp. TaxID=1506 RepID=UPI0025C51236|nr:PHP domain-containing protein [Clostridium sp.]MCE5220849.1 PHP domain-containing protein [Clostridium sp.]